MLYQSLRLRSPSRRRPKSPAVFVTVFLAAFFLLVLVNQVLHPRSIFKSKPKNKPGLDAAHDAEDSSDTVFFQCHGPRGQLSNRSPDLPRPIHHLPNTSYPLTTTGSYEALDIEQTWLTMGERYGPYGYGEDRADYKYPRVDWNTVNWGRLQHDCLVATKGALAPNGEEMDRRPRFRYQNNIQSEPLPHHATGRQAIVLRAWSTYNYQPEDLWSIRSMIVEASLAQEARYDVILLVDVKDEERGRQIHLSDEIYAEVLRDSVPAEFRDIAVLYHVSLQEDWYSRVGDYRPMVQIVQPVQLLAHFYPEYDHYWQIELDTRFTADVGKMLQAFHNFGKAQPYKQAHERSSWAFMPSVHGSYSEFTKAINESLKGDAKVWGPQRIKNFDSIAPEPPMSATEDDFVHGVGRDADLILPNSLSDVNRIASEADWVFKEWYSDDFDRDVPRFLSPPAHARASWDLLDAIHQAQHQLGLRVASEATLPSFAVWHGLKLVGLPLPAFQFPQRDPGELNFILNGGMPQNSNQGMASGPSRYRASSVDFFVQAMTWAWASSLPDRAFNSWMQGKNAKEQGKDAEEQSSTETKDPGPLPSFMAEVDGEVYMPALMLHPRKTNSYISW